MLRATSEDGDPQPSWPPIGRGRSEGAVLNAAAASDAASDAAWDPILASLPESVCAFFESVPVGLAICDAEGAIVATNRIAKRLLGLSMDEPSERAAPGQVPRLLRPDGTPMPPQEHAAARALREGRPVEGVEMGVGRPDGDVVWLSVSATPLPTPGGGTMVSYVDITDRRRAEDDLRQATARSRAIVENAVEGIYQSTPDGRVQWANPAFARMLGFDSSEQLCRELTDLSSQSYVLPERREEFKRQMGEQRVVHGFEAELRHRRGGTVWVALGALAVTDPHGRVLHYQGSAIDITDRKRAETALGDSERRFRALFENLIEGVALHEMVVDDAGQPLDYRLVDVNPAFTAHTGIPLDQARGRLGTEVYGTAAAPYLAEFTGVARTGDSRSFETFFAPLGKHFRLSVVSPQPGTFATVFEDVTERRQTEEALRLSSQRTTALLKLYQMSDAPLHEITTFAMEEAVRLTRSRIGYLAFLSDDEAILTMQAWSAGTMRECAISDKPRQHAVAESGLWGEAVHRRGPVITNDYVAPSPLKRGYPEGHVSVRRHLNLPIFVGSRIVLVAGVGNKEDAYDETDVQELTLLMQGMWRLIERKRAEQELSVQALELTTIHRVSQITLNATSLDEAFQSVAEEICVATGYPIVTVELYDAPAGRMVVKGCCGWERVAPATGASAEVVPAAGAPAAGIPATGVPATRVPAAGASAAGVPAAGRFSLGLRAAQTGLTRLEVRPDQGWDEAEHHLTRHGVRTLLCSPMKIGERTIGAVCLAHPEVRPRDEQLVRLCGSLANSLASLTERRRAEEQIEYLAHHDPLTGLPNRTLFRDRLDMAIVHARRNHLRLGVLFLDLDRFKVINDSLGHSAGDRFLQSVSTRLMGCIRHGDTVVRLGGDEFVVLLSEMAHPEDPARVAAKILEALRQPFEVDGRELFATVSIGASSFPEDGEDAESLLKHADIAMYRAKAAHGNCCRLFTPAMNRRASAQLNLEADLHHAVLREEFIVHYQPMVSFPRGVVEGVEALVRWQHPRRGLVYPSQFIPLAEETGLIVPMGLLVLRTACRESAGWRDADEQPIRLAVNFSLRQLQQPDLLREVEACLRATGRAPGSLDLEITESAAIESVRSHHSVLDELRAAGLRMSLDDFGSGYSSLNHLRRLPIDTLKMDRSFVRSSVRDPSDAAIARAIISMAHSLNQRVVAEGVDRVEQREFLRREGCDAMQGYVFSRPVSAEKIEALLRRRVRGVGLPAA